MSLKYNARLSDHNFAIGTRHKLIPSIYAECKVLENGKVSYSAETFIRVRSGKYDFSTAFAHAFDLRNLLISGSIKRKPILVVEADWAQDEAPRNVKPLDCSVSLFKELKLDALIHGVNAAGLSAFNQVERGMSKLSHNLSGIILTHGT
uniref:Putative LOC100207504 [Hydra vulgaris] n=1 Tax=Lepeophtheirus salmonis TaxID=72036 RepID=A0A0K2V6P6_LEPSM